MLFWSFFISPLNYSFTRVLLFRSWTTFMTVLTNSYIHDWSLSKCFIGKSPMSAWSFTFTILSTLAANSFILFLQGTVMSTMKVQNMLEPSNSVPHIQSPACMLCIGLLHFRKDRVEEKTKFHADCQTDMELDIKQRRSSWIHRAIGYNSTIFNNQWNFGHFFLFFKHSVYIIKVTSS